MNIPVKGTVALLVILAMAVSTPLQATDVYKTFDENGNPIYTDRPPTPESKPISLRELSIVETPEYTSRGNSGQSSSQDDEELTMNELRAMYREFRLVSPAPDQNIWGTGNTATIAWDAGAALQSDMNVVFYVDGQAVSQPTRNATLTTERLDRGEHSARADLLDGQSRVVASTSPVTFFIMQQSRQQAVPQPRAGGN
jgi:hypothetical protein